MLFLETIQSAFYLRNQRLKRNADDLDCLVCAKPIKPYKAKHWVHLHKGGQCVVTPEESEKLDAEGEADANMGLFPVGSDCVRNHPELKDYCHEESENI